MSSASVSSKSISSRSQGFQFLLFYFAQKNPSVFGCSLKQKQKIKQRRGNNFTPGWVSLGRLSDSQHLGAVILNGRKPKMGKPRELNALCFAVELRKQNARYQFGICPFKNSSCSPSWDDNVLFSLSIIIARCDTGRGPSLKKADVDWMMEQLYFFPFSWDLECLLKKFVH